MLPRQKGIRQKTGKRRYKFKDKDMLYNRHIYTLQKEDRMKDYL